MTFDSDSHHLTLRPVAWVNSPYLEKFGIPRQPGLVPAARGYLEMLPGFDRPEAFEGIEGFSHLWVIFGFHGCAGQGRLRVRPPRLGGNREVGVFASRAPYRPNNLGLSVLCLEGIEQAGGGLRLEVSGLDLQHGTPVYDIKPYVPYADSLPDATGGFADQAPPHKLEVAFSSEARGQLAGRDDAEQLAELIVQTLSLDPRPAYRQGESGDRQYGMALAGLDVRWRVRDGQAVVEQIVSAAG